VPALPLHGGGTAAREQALQARVGGKVVRAHDVRRRPVPPGHHARLLLQADQALRAEPADRPVGRGGIAIVVEARPGHLRLDGDRAVAAGHEAGAQVWPALVRQPSGGGLLGGRVDA